MPAPIGAQSAGGGLRENPLATLAQLSYFHQQTVDTRHWGAPAVALADTLRLGPVRAKVEFEVNVGVVNLVIATVVGCAVVLGVALTLMRHFIGKVEESLAARMEAMENRIVSTLRLEMVEQINQLRQELRADIAEVRQGLHELAQRVARLEGALRMDSRVGVSPQAT